MCELSFILTDFIFLLETSLLMITENSSGFIDIASEFHITLNIYEKRRGKTFMCVNISFINV